MKSVKEETHKVTAATKETARDVKEDVERKISIAYPLIFSIFGVRLSCAATHPDAGEPMERKTLVLLGLGLIVIAAAIGAGCTNTPAPGESAVPTRTAVQTAGTLRAPATLAPADALDAVASRAQAALDRLDR